jgi:hypothetical protein
MLRSPHPSFTLLILKSRIERPCHIPMPCPVSPLQTGATTMAVPSLGNWRSVALFGFRASAVGQMIAVFGQAVLAGLALSGSPGALDAHMMNGAIAVVFSIAQVVFGLLSRSELPRWALAASIGLLLGEGAQMASGRFYWLAVHLPLGVALFAMLVPLIVWIVRGTPAMLDHARIPARADVAVRTA